MRSLTLLFVMMWFVTFVSADDAGLVGHWKLAGDAQDSSGNSNHGQIHGVVFTLPDRQGNLNRAARFDGRSTYIEVANSPSLQFGKDDFSLAVWVNTNKDLDDIPGDIINKFDSRNRRGLLLNVNHASVTSAQSNTRNLHFGIDCAQGDKAWLDCGRPGKSVFVFALAVFNGELFAGTTEADVGSSGHVFRYAGANGWIDCGSLDQSNSVSSLVVHEGNLYAATSKYRLAGSALSESENPNLGGKVYRYEGDKKWVDCGQLPDAEAVGGMVVFRGKLYAGSLYKPAGFFRYDGDQKWTSCGSPNGKRVEALAIFNGAIYATGYDEGHVYRFDGDTWTDLGRLGETNQTYGFAIHHGKLYVSTWPKALLYRLDQTTPDQPPKWTEVGRPGEELETMAFALYNGKLYTGTLPMAEVYRYDGETEWTRITRLDLTPDVKYRRVWSMATFQGRLFAGTLPSGHIYSFEAGRNATYDRELPHGWQHLAAVKCGGKLELFLNGDRIATSASFSTEDFDLSNDQPLKIGFGSNDYWNGSLSELRIYRRALNEVEIRKLSDKP